MGWYVKVDHFLLNISQTQTWSLSPGGFFSTQHALRLWCALCLTTRIGYRLARVSGQNGLDPDTPGFYSVHPSARSVERS